MEKEFIAFISLGFPCSGGPQIGQYGTFSVDLTRKEMNQIDEVASSQTDDYKCYELEKRYPKLHKKILDSAASLAREFVIMNAVQFLELPEDDQLRLEKLNPSAAADYFAKKYDLEPESLDDVEICYYLTNDEVPSDYISNAPKIKVLFKDDKFISYVKNLADGYWYLCGLYPESCPYVCEIGKEEEDGYTVRMMTKSELVELLEKSGYRMATGLQSPLIEEI